MYDTDEPRTGVAEFVGRRGGVEGGRRNSIGSMKVYYKGQSVKLRAVTETVDKATVTVNNRHSRHHTPTRQPGDHIASPNAQSAKVPTRLDLILPDTPALPILFSRLP